MPRYGTKRNPKKKHMSSMFNKTLYIFILSICVLASSGVNAKSRSEQWGEVKDPHFGEVLFDFYGQNYFSSITGLMVADKMDRLEHHSLHSELLMGGLMVSYGMHDKASQIFDSMISQDVPTSVRDRIWFYIGKIRYQRNYYDDAENAFAKIKDKLPKELENERYILLSNILMAKNKPVKAIEALNKMSGSTIWETYGQYNLGVALIKTGKRELGIKLLSRVGELEAKDEEARSLKDKANLALGYIHLQEKSPEQATLFLKKVRLSGPLSNKALLGMGWAHSSLEKYDRALVYWNELKQRDVIDAAVQESLLAVPHALGKAKVYRQATEQYQRAQTVFKKEIRRIDNAIVAIRAGKLVRQIDQLDPRKEVGWFWALNTLPDSPESRYLAPLLAGHDFQETLKIYRDTRFLRDNVQRWKKDLAIFDDILIARRSFYEKRLPGISQRFTRLDENTLRMRRAQLERKVSSVSSTAQANDLATDDELRKFRELSRLQRRLSRLKKKYGAAAVADSEDRLRILNGDMVWKIENDFAPRLWGMEKSLAEIDQGLEQTQSDRTMLTRIKSSSPARFNAFKSQIQGMHRRIDQVSNNAKRLEERLANRIQTMAILGLEIQRERLSTYLTQAKFGATQLIDEAASQKK